MRYVVNAETSEEMMDNNIQFYKEDEKIWISIGEMEERGFTIDKAKEIISKLTLCIKE